MSEPITVTEHVATYKQSERSWTYEELLDLFDDDTNLVKPLVLRCQQYEAEIEKLRKSLLNGTMCCRTDDDTGDGILTVRFANSCDAHELQDLLAKAVN